MLAEAITYLFIAVFIYTATDKFINLQSFERFMVKMIFMQPAGKYVAIFIPAIEVFIALLLLFPKSRLRGLQLTLSLMLLFTGYLLYMKVAAKMLPCHCGGVISSLSWTQHIYLNLGLVMLAAYGMKLINHYKIKHN